MLRNEFAEVGTKIPFSHPRQNDAEPVVSRVIHHTEDRQNMLIPHVERHQRVPVKNLSKYVRSGNRNRSDKKSAHSRASCALMAGPCQSHEDVSMLLSHCCRFLAVCHSYPPNRSPFFRRTRVRPEQTFVGGTCLS